MTLARTDIEPRCKECGGFVDNQGFCVEGIFEGESHHSGWEPCDLCQGTGFDSEGITCVRCDEHGLVGENPPDTDPSPDPVTIADILKTGLE